MTNCIDKKLKYKLNFRKEEGTLRSLSSFEGYIDFFSNDYLGFSKLDFNHSKIGGSSGSRLISGTSPFVLELEKSLAEKFHSESALIFNSGFDANLGLLGSVLQRSDIVIYDEFVHASIRDGIRLGNAKSYAFKHNSIGDLRTKLERFGKGVYVVIESLYSMDGDITPLHEVVNLCKEFEAYLIVDEAHSGGVYGRSGSGLITAHNLDDQVFAKIITFGKAFGSHGAVILGSNLLIEYLINFSRSFIYTTALPRHSYEIINFVVNSESLINLQQEKLKANIDFFNQLINQHFSDLDSPIKIIRLGDVKKTKALAKILNEKKIAVKPIFSPTVPQGSEGVRICLHSFNSKDQIETIASIVNEFISD